MEPKQMIFTAQLKHEIELLKRLPSALKYLNLRVHVSMSNGTSDCVFAPSTLQRQYRSAHAVP